MKKTLIAIASLLVIGILPAQVTGQDRGRAPKPRKEDRRKVQKPRKEDGQRAQKKKKEDRRRTRKQREQERSRLTRELRLHGWYFGNFFQASEAANEDDVAAAGAEARLAWEGKKPLTPYLHINLLKFEEDGLDQTYGGRLGARYKQGPHSVDVFADHQQDRPTFDIGEVFDTADVTRLSADYSYRITKAWEAGAVAERQNQSFDQTQRKDNEFAGFGASVRYRGFGSIFSPEIGFMTGERDVDDETESYDQDDLYAQIRSAPRRDLYLSFRYRMRTRDYTTRALASPNAGREDERGQWTMAADWTMSRRLTWNFYYALEDAQSTRADREFETQTVMLGVTMGF